MGVFYIAIKGKTKQECLSTLAWLIENSSEEFSDSNAVVSIPNPFGNDTIDYDYDYEDSHNEAYLANLKNKE